MKAGDESLRQDVQVLADFGIIKTPVSTWPLAWGPVLESIRQHGDSDLPELVRAALGRVQARAQRETRLRESSWTLHASIAGDPARIRGYRDTPREDAEAGIAYSWTGDRFAVVLDGQVVDDSGGGSDVRVDGSMIAVALGNWVLSANTLDRWWGPGHDGSLVMSGNARPIPAISLDRSFPDQTDLPLLRWLGPWDLNIMMGQLENDRAIPNARFFGMRFNFRPLPSLEVGLSRAAQWCGDDRPCDTSTFFSLLTGRDNRGDAGIDTSNEPGNQLAGIDLRWSRIVFGRPAGVYGQFIGEDEAGGFPSRYLGQVGIDISGTWRDSWSWRWFGEFAGTSCQFHESSKLYNCGYNHDIYLSGYRYRQRSIGHGADNDAEVFSTGLLLVDDADTQWSVIARYGNLNDGGSPDPSNALTPVPEDLASLDVHFRRTMPYGVITAGLGFERRNSAAAGSDSDVRYFVQWRSR